MSSKIEVIFFLAMYVDRSIGLRSPHSGLVITSLFSVRQNMYYFQSGTEEQPVISFRVRRTPNSSVQIRTLRPQRLRLYGLPKHLSTVTRLNGIVTQTITLLRVASLSNLTCGKLIHII